MYDEGDGVEQNKQKAAFWYTKLAERNVVPEAQYRLGIMYDKGDGVEQNKLLANKYFKQSRSEERRVGKEGSSRWTPYH